MTELAPVGYVGVSPQCLLGFNKVYIHVLFVRHNHFVFSLLCSGFDFLKYSAFCGVESRRGDLSTSSD